MVGKNHHYAVTVQWTGNTGTGTSGYRDYGRQHEISADGKPAIGASSDPVFRGDRARWNPEELLVAALSSCHQLAYLHLCADAGIVVTEYTDDAWGEMVEHLDGSGEMTRVILRPRLRITDAARAGDLPAIHSRAHEVCCLARSVRFEVTHEADVVI